MVSMRIYQRVGGGVIKVLILMTLGIAIMIKTVTTTVMIMIEINNDNDAKNYEYKGTKNRTFYIQDTYTVYIRIIPGVAGIVLPLFAR